MILIGNKGYSGIPATAYNSYETKPAFFGGNGVAAASTQPWSLSQTPAGVFAYDESPSAQYLPEFPVLQPTRSQPSTRNEEMTYQMPTPDRKHPARSEPQRANTDTHVTYAQDFGHHHPPYVSPGGDSSRYSAAVGFIPLDGSGDGAPAHQPANLDIVSSHQRPPPAKRGPFKSNVERERTAETRKIGSCIRCRMQRIRVSPSFRDEPVTGLTHAS